MIGGGKRMNDVGTYLRAVDGSCFISVKKAILN